MTIVNSANFPFIFLTNLFWKVSSRQFFANCCSVKIVVVGHFIKCCKFSFRPLFGCCHCGSFISNCATFCSKHFFCNLMSSIIFCNFTNCSSRQIVCKLLFRTIYFQTVVVDLLFANFHTRQLIWQIIILDNFLANCHSGQFFLQIIDLNNFLLRMVIVNCFFYKLSFQLYLFEKCPSGQSLCNLSLWINHLANCPF